MSNNLIRLLLQAGIDEKGSIVNIENQLKQISNNIKPIEIKFDLDQAKFKDLKLISEQLQKQMASSTRLNIDTAQVEKGLVKITHHFKGAETEANKMTKTTTEGFKTIKESIDLINKTPIKTDVTENFEKQQKLIEQVELYQKKMHGDMDIFAQKNKGKFDETQLDALRQRMESLSIASGDAKREMKEISIEMNHMTKQVSHSNSMLSQITENFLKFARFYIVGQAIVSFKRSVEDGIKSVVDLDTSLTELSKVTDLSGNQLKIFTGRAYEAGVELARTGKEVVDATSEFSRAGYNIESAFKLSKDALLFTNIADGIDSVKEASSSMIAILKGFKMEAQDASHIIDALNEVSNNYALDTVNLTEILKRTSGTIAQTGTSYEELIGLATGGFESLRNSEMVASGINMISQRLRGMTESGEAVEGLIPKIQADLQKYTNGAVSIIDKQNGGLHSTFEILQQLQKVYPTLTDEAKAYVNEAIAGNRQNKVLVSILDNWKNVEGAIVSATNSAGSAMAENEKYLNSIEGKSKQLSSSMQLFWNNFINADAIKNGIDLLNGFVTVLDKLVNNSFSQFVIQTGIAYGALLLFSKGFVAFKATAIGTALVTKGLSGAIGALTASMSINPLFLGAAVAIGTLIAIAKFTDKYGDSLKNLKEKIDETTSALAESQSEYDALKSKENLTEEQKLYLKLLEKEIERKKESLAVDTEMALKREFLNKETLKGGGRSVELSSGVEKIHQSIASLQEYKSELRNIDVEQEKGKKQWDDISSKIRDAEDVLNEQLKTIVTGIEKIKEYNPEFVAPQELEEAVVVMKDALGITEGLNDGINNTSTSFKNFDVVVNTLKESVSTLGGQLEELESIQDKVNDGYVFTYKEISELRKTYPELEKAIYRTADGWKVEKGALDKVREAMIDHTRNQIKLEKENTENTIEEIKKRLKARLTEAKSLSKLIGAEFNDIGILEAEQPKKPMDGSGKTIIENMVTDARNKAIQANRELFKTQSALEDIESSLKELEEIGSGRTSGEKKEKKKKEEYKAEADIYTKINQELERNNNLLQKNKTLQDLAGDDLAKKIKLIEEEMQLYKERQNLLNQLNEQRRARGAQLQKELQGIFKFEGNWADNSITITNHEKLNGQTKGIKEKYDEIMSIIKELPNASQEWLNILNTIGDKGLEKIKLEFELADQATNKLKASVSELEYEFKLLEDTDLVGKGNNIVQQMVNIEQQVKDAQAELEKLNSLSLKEGSKEAELYAQRHEELTKRIQEGTLAINDYNKSLDNLYNTARQDWISKANEALKERRERLQSLQQIEDAIVQIIRKRGEEEKKALDEAHKLDMDSLEKRHQERKKKYQEELDLFKKMIQDKIDALDEQYAEEDYLEQLNKEREEANRLQREIDVLSLDDSLTARNKTIELRKQLADQNEKIAKMQQKKERDTLKKSLQDQLKNREQDAKDKEAIADKTYENDKKRLEEDYRINKEFLDRKYSDEQVYAEARESIMRGTVEVAEGMFVDIYDAYKDFENKFGRGMGILGDIIKKDFLDQLEKAQQAVRDLEYLSRARDDYDSDYRPRDDEWDYRDPRDKGGSGSGGGRNDDSYKNHKLYNEFRAYENMSLSDLQEKFAWAEKAYDSADNNQAREFLLDVAEAANRFANLKRGNGFIADATNWFKARGRNVVKGYDRGGKVDYDGLAMVHGEDSPEWMLRDFQLKKIVSDSVLSTIRVAIPKIPNVTARQGVTLQIDNFIKTDNITKESIPELKKIQVNAMEDLKNLLIKNGVRPSFK